MKPQQRANNDRQTEYDVFISHATEDTNWCEHFARHLHNAGLRVWLDKWEMDSAGIDLVGGMEEGLRQSRRAVLVLTPEYLNEKKVWAAAERYYITYKNITGRNEYAIPLLLKDCILPPFLESLKYLDFRNPVAYEANLQQIIKMLKMAQVDDATPTLADLPDAVPALGQLPLNSYLPHEWNPYFVGRDEELLQLHRLLNRGANIVAVNQVVNKVAATGLGGVGKTQLAIEYAFRYGRYYTGGVYWLNDLSLDNYQTALAALAVPMNLNLPVDLSEKDRAEYVLAVLRRPEPRLLIFDNLLNLNVLGYCSAAGGGCRVLITTRRKDLERVEQLPIDVLNKDAALVLLLSRRPDLQSSTSHSVQLTGKEICARLGHLPLALEFAAYYLGRHKRLSLAEYLKELENVGTLDHTVSIGAGHYLSPTGYNRSLVESFQLSFRELTASREPEAKKLFFTACQFAQESINLNLLGKVAELDLSSHHSEDALNILFDLSLCKQAENGRLLFHRLVIDFGRSVTPKKYAAKLQRRLMTTMAEFMQTANNVIRLNEVQQELPHAIRAAEMAVSQKVWPWNFELCRMTGEYFFRAANFPVCSLWFQSAKQACEAHKNLNKKYFATILNNIGMLLYEQGFRDSAMSHLQKALTIRRKTLGEKDVAVAQSLKNIGEVLLMHDGKWDKALNNFRQALDIEYQNYGNEHPDVASTLNIIGLVLFEQWNLTDALAKYKQALAIRLKVLGQQHPDVAESLHCIGTVLHAQGDLKGAMAHYRHALTIWKKVFGEEHPYVATALHSIGEVLQTQKDWVKASEHLQQALATFEKFLGPNHFKTKTVRESLDKVQKGEEKHLVR